MLKLKKMHNRKARLDKISVGLTPYRNRMMKYMVGLPRLLKSDVAVSARSLSCLSGPGLAISVSF